jgi:hypothetical protein
MVSRSPTAFRWEEGDQRYLPGTEGWYIYTEAKRLCKSGHIGSAPDATALEIAAMLKLGRTTEQFADRLIEMQDRATQMMQQGSLSSAAKSSHTEKKISEKLEEMLRYFTYKTCDWANKDSNVGYLTGLVILSYSLIIFRLPMDWVGPGAMIATAMAMALMSGHWPSVALILMLKFL